MKTKKITAIIICLCMLCSTGITYADYYDGEIETAGNPDTSDWYEWKWPDDTAALGTAIDASVFLDAPAGKHGFLKRGEGRKMVFEDGTPARFWGTNIAMMGCFPEHDEAEILAERIARVGFNLVRIHNIDMNFPNIFTDPETGYSGNINEDQFDKLMYFIYQLKIRGVYVYVDWLCNRSIQPNEENPQMVKYIDGVMIKTMVYFNDELQQMNMDYGRQLYTTVNPYTGLALCDDPAMAFIDMQNEYGGLTIPANTFKEKNTYYFAEVTSKYNRWLQKKYVTTAELEKAWKSDGKIGLRSGENIEEGTVVFIDDIKKEYPNYMNDLNFSEARKNDWKDFMYENWYRYNTEMRDFLRDELGVKCMITTVGGGGTTNFKAPTTYMNIQEFDYTDCHSYKSHPVGWSLTKGESITGWSSVLMYGGQEQNRFLWYFTPHDQPYIVGEWQICYPGIHSSDGEVFQAIFGSKQEWNPIQFCMIGNFPEFDNEGNYILNDSFQTFYDAAKTTIQPLAAMMYHHGDIKPMEEEYYFSLDYETSRDDRLLLDQNHFLGPDTIYAYTKTGVHYEGASKSDYKQNPEEMERAMKRQANNEMQDDQMYWNMDTGILTLETEHSNAAMGYIGDKDINLDFMNVKLEHYYGTIVLTSNTNDPLTTTDRMVLGGVIEGRDKGLKLDDASALTVVQVSEGPMLLCPVVADIELKTTDDIEVYALDESGQRICEVPVTRNNNNYACFKMDGVQYKSSHYEIVRK